MPKFRVLVNCYIDLLGVGRESYYARNEVVEIGSKRDIDELRRFRKKLQPLDVEAEEMLGAPMPDPDPEPKPQEPQTPAALLDAQTRIRAAAGRLDDANPAHWTQQGLPSVEAINELITGDEVTRAEINAAVPGLTRNRAES